MQIKQKPIGNMKNEKITQELYTIKRKIEHIQQIGVKNKEINEIFEGISGRVDLLLKIFYLNKIE